MTTRPGDVQAAEALRHIDHAFAHRVPPSRLTDSKQLSDAEHADVMSFHGTRWTDVTFAQVEQHPDAVFWFSPAAFCYYLPGLLAAGLKEHRWDSNAYDSLIGSLDRDPERENWDDFFLPRWPGLTVAEVDAVATWVHWLEIVEPDMGRPGTYRRVKGTLALLKATAIGQAAD